MCSVPCKVAFITLITIIIANIIIIIVPILRNVVLYTHYSGEVSNIVDEHFTKALNQTTFSELKGDDDDNGGSDDDDGDNGDDNDDDDDAQKGKGAAVALTDVTG